MKEVFEIVNDFDLLLAEMLDGKFEIDKSEKFLKNLTDFEKAIISIELMKLKRKDDFIEIYKKANVVSDHDLYPSALEKIAMELENK